MFPRSRVLGTVVLVLDASRASHAATFTVTASDSGPGCGGNDDCPTNPVLRQMAVFLVKTSELPF